MTIQDLGSLGELVAAIATIATLAYLAVQIRQNTQALRLSVHHALSDSHSHYNLLLAQDADLARLLRAGAENLAVLSADDRERFDRLLWHVYIQIEDAYYHLREGSLPDPLAERFSKVMPTFLDQPGLRSWFETRKHLMSEEFVRHVEANVLPGL